MGAEIFLVVMICSADLLSCDNRSSARPFEDLDGCLAKRAELIRSGYGLDGEPTQVFARCQFLLARDVRAEPTESADPAAIEVTAW